MWKIFDSGSTLDALTNRKPHKRKLSKRSSDHVTALHDEADISEIISVCIVFINLSLSFQCDSNHFSSLCLLFGILLKSLLLTWMWITKLEGLTAKSSNNVGSMKSPLGFKVFAGK